MRVILEKSVIILLAFSTVIFLFDYIQNKHAPFFTKERLTIAIEKENQQLNHVIYQELNISKSMKGVLIEGKSEDGTKVRLLLQGITVVK